MGTETITTAEQYLAFERSREDRHEFVNGIVRPRATSNLVHATLVASIASEISIRLRDQPCMALMVMRIKVSRTGMYAYPDVLAICGQPLVEDEYDDTVMNPAMILEVYSDETEAFDRGERFAHYRQIDTLREYILVAQNKVRVEKYVRDGDRWPCQVLKDRVDTLRIDVLGCELPLSEIYDPSYFQQMKWLEH